ncbi:MAG: hypothetical protein M0D55_18280 [Elusimicrobiota bacterium]|nr:MAG: hypothetical protein M0D55_18280 [Elusimicrobiota bacterium]
MRADKKKIPKPSRPIPANPSGEPEEMQRIGESISGSMPDIGEKDIGAGTKPRQPPPGEKKPRH